MLTYRVEEITSAKLRPGEDEELRDETRRLANAEQLAELAGEAYRAIRQPLDGTPSASDLLSIAAEALTKLVKIDAAPGKLVIYPSRSPSRSMSWPQPGRLSGADRVRPHPAA